MPLTPDEIRPRLRGIISFPITPFDDDLRLKENAFQTHVDYLVRSGMHSIVAAGGTGELYSMTTDEIRRVYRLAVEAVGGRVRPPLAELAEEDRQALRSALSAMGYSVAG